MSAMSIRCRIDGENASATSPRNRPAGVAAPVGNLPRQGPGLGLEIMDECLHQQGPHRVLPRPVAAAPPGVRTTSDVGVVVAHDFLRRLPTAYATPRRGVPSSRSAGATSIPAPAGARQMTCFSVAPSAFARASIAAIVLPRRRVLNDCARSSGTILVGGRLGAASAAMRTALSGDRLERGFS
jgi:hypothetical protein